MAAGHLLWHWLVRGPKKRPKISMIVGGTQDDLRYLQAIGKGQEQRCTLGRTKQDIQSNQSLLSIDDHKGFNGAMLVSKAGSSYLNQVSVVFVLIILPNLLLPASDVDNVDRREIVEWVRALDCVSDVIFDILPLIVIPCVGPLKRWDYKYAVPGERLIYSVVDPDWHGNCPGGFPRLRSERGSNRLVLHLTCECRSHPCFQRFRGTNSCAVSKAQQPPPQLARI